MTNDPNPVRFDGEPPVYKSERIRVASLGASSLTGLLSQIVTSAVSTTPNVYCFINDHLGTPQVITDAQGQVVWQTDNEPFGGANLATASVVNNFRFPGQYYDEESGLHYNWHRYYDPQTGRYLTPDPIGMAGGINLYSYALQNPIKLIDPFGLFIAEEMPKGEIGNTSFSIGFGGGLGFRTYNIEYNLYSNEFSSTPDQVTSSIAGIGMLFCVNDDDKQCDNKAKSITPKSLSAGVYKRLSISGSVDFSNVCINIGISADPLPISYSGPIAYPNYSDDYSDLILF